uniref:Uncharacterized protein n=1 Tax=viral metagenome TaxID=1070528 RepID=A0A6M3IJM9_9ZZZZ
MNKFLHWLIGRTSFLCRVLHLCGRTHVSICATTGMIPNYCCKKAGSVAWRKFRVDKKPTMPCLYHRMVSAVICPESRLLVSPYCHNYVEVVTRDMCQADVPHASCAVHKKPVPPEVKYLACKKSGKLATLKCPNTHFVTGEALPALCPDHPIVKYMTASPRFRYGLWMLLGFLDASWNPEDEEAALENLYSIANNLRLNGVSLVEGFTWVRSMAAEHAHLNAKIPWAITTDGKVNFIDYNPRYWELFKKFDKVLASCDLGFQPTLVMREYYSEPPFKENVNGITRLKSMEAVDVVSALMWKFATTQRENRGPKYKPTVKVANEWMHSSPDEFEFNGIFHRKVLDDFVNEGYGGTLGNATVDVAESEGTATGVGESRYHPKIDKIYPLPGEEIIQPPPDRMDASRSVLLENHGNGTIWDIGHEVMDPADVLAYWKEAFDRDIPEREALIIFQDAYKLCREIGAPATFVPDYKEKLRFLISGNIRYCFSLDGGSATKTGKSHVQGGFYWPTPEQYRVFLKFLKHHTKLARKDFVISLADICVFRRPKDISEWEWKLWREGNDPIILDWPLIGAARQELCD